jgi:glucokinase
MGFNSRMAHPPGNPESDTSLSPAPCLLGVEIGGTKLQIAAGTAGGQILERRRFQVERSAGAEGIRTILAQALPELIQKWRPGAVGVGYGGPVNWRTGRIARSYHIEGWSDFPLANWIQERTGVPVFVENDANTAALGEALFGAGRGAEPVLWMNAGSGVGGGLVVNGRIYHGAPPGEVELGHLRLNREGTITEDLCSGWSVDRMVRDAAAADPDGFLAKSLAGTAASGGEARALAPAIAAGDAAALGILQSVAESLAYALSHAVHLLHPEVVVFGGGLALIGEPLRARIAAALPRWLMDTFQPGPEIRLALLMEDAVLAGSLAVAAGRLAQVP